MVVFTASWSSLDAQIPMRMATRPSMQAIFATSPSPFQVFFIDGLPAPAAVAQDKNELNTGRTPIAKIYRLDENLDCTSPPFVHRAVGFNAQAESDDGFSWKGKFVLFRPRGQFSNDPGGFDVDGNGGFFVLNGQLTFEDTSFTIKKYKGKTSVDVCAALA